MQSSHLGNSSFSMEDDFASGHSNIQAARRESFITNDDDYDYALELEADEEYRLVMFSI